MDQVFMRSARGDIVSVFNRHVLYSCRTACRISAHENRRSYRTEQFGRFPGGHLKREGRSQLVPWEGQQTQPDYCVLSGGVG